MSKAWILVVGIVVVFFCSSVEAQIPIPVTATVPDNPLSYDVSISATPSGMLGPSEDVVVQVQYSSQQLWPIAPFIVELQWFPGVLTGGSGTSNILSYVDSSASLGYNATPPVYDIAHNTIRWTIPSFPPGDHAVTAKLRTIDAYTGSDGVTARIAARIISPTTTTSDKFVNVSYRNIAPVTPTVGIPTGTQRAVPTETTKAKELFIEEVRMQGVDASSAVIYVRTSVPTTAVLVYGTQPQNLFNELSDISSLSARSLSIAELQPSTRYYAQWRIRDGKREIRTTLFTFMTASVDEEITIDPSSVVVNANDVILSWGKERSPLMLPFGTNYSFRFSLEDPNISLRSLWAYVRSQNVLGIETRRSVSPPTNNIELVSLEDSYMGRLKVPSKMGTYTILVRTETMLGTIAEHTLVSLRAVPPLRIVGSNGKPVKARVFFSYFDRKKKIFRPVSAPVINIENPLASDKNGTVTVAFPRGTYRADVSAFGYQDKQVDFSLSDAAARPYPEIRLTPQKESLWSWIRYYISQLDNRDE